MSDIHSDQDKVAGEVVDIDQPCTHCGYNLRSLNVQGRCPECGSDVADSLHGDLLRAADKVWLGRLRLGTSVKLFNIVLYFLVGILGSLIAGVLAIPVIMDLIAIAAAGLGVWATFLITTQEPRISLNEQPVTLRRIIRGFACASVVSSVLGSFDAGIIPDLFYELIIGVGQLGYVVASLGELAYYRRFAMRIPNPKLAKSTKRLFWSIIIFGGLPIIVTIDMMVSTGTTDVFISSSLTPGSTSITTTSTSTVQTTTTTATLGIPEGLLLILGCSALLLMLFFLAWYLQLLSKYKKAFKDAIEWEPPPTAKPMSLDV